MLFGQNFQGVSNFGFYYIFMNKVWKFCFWVSYISFTHLTPMCASVIATSTVVNIFLPACDSYDIEKAYLNCEDVKYICKMLY